MGQKHSDYPAPMPGLDLLSHELGNVLNGISGMVRLLRSSGLTPEQQNWLQAIERSGQQMKRLAEFTACLSISGSSRPAIARFDGIELLEQLIFAHTPSARAAGIRLILQLEPGLSPGWTSNRCLLNQLLDNLLGNAIKFSAEGDVILHACPGQDGSLRLSVSDSGPGISDEEALRVFEPYYRVSETRPGQPGQGLGLFMCRHIVDTLGGSIRILRANGPGTCIQADFPGVSAFGDKAGAGSGVFEDLLCFLSLDPTMGRAVACLLDRLGVSWSDTRRTFARHEDHAIRVLISAEPGGGAVLALCDRQARSQVGRSLLLAPVLNATLEPALLRLVLESRWEALSPGDKPG